MTLDEAIAQTPDLNTIAPATIATWATLYTRGHNQDEVRAAMERARRLRAAPTAAPMLVPIITLDSIRACRAKRAAQAKRASPAPRGSKRPSGR